jgi:hypothetical protein
MKYNLKILMRTYIIMMLKKYSLILIVEFLIFQMIITIKIFINFKKMNYNNN